MSVDLGKLIHSPHPLTPSHFNYFMYQLLRGVLYLHSANIMHRDIKPSNILMNMNCDLKICDFGLSRGIYQNIQEQDKVTKYVVTRWYRAPEVVLNTSSYTGIIDLWSVGCVFAELLGRKPIFPGEN
jgi:mitogen-activated protein kinase 1/3